MEFQEYLPIWNKLSAAHQELIAKHLIPSRVTKGTVIHNGNLDCSGLILIKSGQLRAYILSEEGREITLYRLFDRDICLLTATCILRSIQFEVIIQAEKDSELWTLPPYIYQSILTESAPMANYTNELMATRFSDVIWLMEQVMWKSLDKRVAAFLLEEAAIEGTDKLRITHEAVANHLGSHREVITRMLRYFQNESMVRLSRGAIEILDADKLRRLGDL